MSLPTQSPDIEDLLGKDDDFDRLLIEEQLAQERADALDKIEALGQRLMRLANQQIIDRQPIEDRWIEDIRQWHGRYDPDTERKLKADPTRSSVFSNLTRSKTNAAEARLIEILLPVDDRNWGLKLTPVPDYSPEAFKMAGEYSASYLEEDPYPEEQPGGLMGGGEEMPGMGLPPDADPSMAGMMPPDVPMEAQQAPVVPPEMPDGMSPEMSPEMSGDMGMDMGAEQPQPQEPPPPPEESKFRDPMEVLRRQAHQRMKLMQDEIDDQLAECHYNSAARQVIHDICLLGTGVIKGPYVVNRTKKRWARMEDDTGSIYVLEEEQVLRPAATHVDVWNFFPDMSATNIRDAEFTFERGFYTKSKVRGLLKLPGFIKEQIERVLEQGPNSTRIDRTYLDRVREISGLTAPDNNTLYEVWRYYGPVSREDLMACGCEEEMLPSEVDDVVGEVWLIGDIVVKADISVVDTQDNVYSVVNWEEDAGSIFGYGIPWRTRNPQRVANAALRMVMENGGFTAKPQLVYNQEVIEPADGDWRMTPGKEWRVTDKNMTVANAFGLFETNSHQAELMEIFNLAKHLMDEESAVPALPQNQDMGNMSPTLGGMSILMNAANIVLRRVVKAFDDNITVPLLTRFYDWNMQYSEREDIKGDYVVDPRGASYLLAKEAQSQALIQVMQYADSPMFRHVFRADVIAKGIAKALQLPVEEITNSPEEIERLRAQEAENQPRDPQVERTEMVTEAQRYKMDVTYKMHTERMQQQLVEFRLRAIEAQKNWESQVMKLMGEKEMTADKLKTEIAKLTIKESSQNERFMKELAAKNAMGVRGNIGLES